MAALGWDAGRVYHAHVLPGEKDFSREGRSAVEAQFYEFILEFRLGTVFVYRDQLQANIVASRFFLDVNVEHLIMANEQLADKLKTDPAETLPLVDPSARMLTTSLSALSRDTPSRRSSLSLARSTMRTRQCGISFPTARSLSIQTRTQPQSVT
jgi:MCM N-terminal domain